MSEDVPPNYTLERVNGVWCLCQEGIPCQEYESLAEAKENNPGVKVIQN